MIDLHYRFIHRHILYGVESWGHGSASSLNQILVKEKGSKCNFETASSSTITYKFYEHKIMSFNRLSKYRLIIFMYTVFKNDKTC